MSKSRLALYTAITAFTALLIVTLGLAGGRNDREDLDALTTHRMPERAQGTVTVCWFGATSLLVRDAHTTLLINPFFTRPPGLLRLLANAQITPNRDRIVGELNRVGVQRIDAVLTSNSHYDNAMDAGVAAVWGGAQLIGSESTLNIGRGAGVAEDRLTRVVPRQPIRVGDFRITFIESGLTGGSGGQPRGDITQQLHPPARYFDYKLGGAYSILIEHPAGTLLHQGSTGTVSGALAGHHADVVFLSVAMISDLPTYLHETVDAVGARRVVPLHWDDFTRDYHDPRMPMPFVVHLDRFFAAMAARPQVAVQSLESGKPVTLF